MKNGVPLAMPAPEPTVTRRSLGIVVAWPAEAKPIIEGLKLERTCVNASLEIYHKGASWLVISGQGRARAHRAVLELSRASSAKTPWAWLNVGICGHGEREVGEILLASEVLETASGVRWEMAINWEAPCPLSPIHTVDVPETRYGQPVAYEMEASGFLRAASRLSPLSLIHCLKVVSDTASHGLSEISERSATEQIDRQFSRIVWVMDHLSRSIDSIQKKK